MDVEVLINSGQDLVLDTVSNNKHHSFIDKGLRINDNKDLKLSQRKTYFFGNHVQFEKEYIEYETNSENEDDEVYSQKDQDKSK